jgi:ADP-ribose pyrophosphatase
MPGWSPMPCWPPARTARRRNEIGDSVAKPGPAAWSVRSSRYSFRDRWLAVRSDCCTAADGTAIDPYHVVELPDWVNILALTPEQDVVLVREYRHGTAEITLELPSGTVEAGEAPLVTAQRELREETGYGGGVWRKTAVFAANPARQNNRVSTFLAIGVTPLGTPRPEAGEVIETVRMKLPALFAGLADGTLRFQTQHMAALLGYLLPVLTQPDSLIRSATQSWLSQPDPPG